MKGLAILLIVVGITLELVGTSGGSGQDQFHLAGGLLVFFGIILLVISVFIASRQNAQLSQLEQYQRRADPDGQMPVGEDRGQLEGFDASGIMRTVMDAQNESGGDPDVMADLLRQKLGADATVIEGDSSVEVSGGAASQNPVSLLSTLSDLRDKGVLTDEQFDEQKKRLLDTDT